MNAVDLVSGVKYVAMTYGYGNSPGGGLEENIFISTYELTLTEDGDVYAAECRSITGAEAQAENEALDEINSGKYQGLNLSSREITKRAVDAAAQTALTPVQISRDLLDRIQTLYKRSVDANTPKEEVPSLKRDIKQLIQQSGLFARRDNPKRSLRPLKGCFSKQSERM